MSDMKAPDYCWTALVRPAGPNPSCGALFYPAGPCFVLREPCSSHRTRIRPTKPCSVLLSLLLSQLLLWPTTSVSALAPEPARLHLSTAPVLVKLSSAQASPAPAQSSSALAKPSSSLATAPRPISSPALLQPTPAVL